MAQMLTGTSPEAVRDEIADWLDWQAKRQANVAQEPGKSEVSAVARQFAGELLAELATELRTVPPSPTLINFRSLLRRYIGHVLESEGTDFLCPPYRTQGAERFSGDEWAELKALATAAERGTK